MMIFKELSIILALYLFGELIALSLPFTFPGGIIGMLILFILLSLKWIKMDDIKNVSTFLLQHMAFFFIPAGVSIMGSFTLMKDYLVPISATLLLSTLIVLSITALIVDFFVKKTE